MGEERTISADELVHILEFDEEISKAISPAAMISFQGVTGIAYSLCENISSGWHSGDIICLWEDGECTIVPDECLLLRENLWEI